MWPVMLIPYNLPSWKCIKSESIMLSLLIPSLTASRNNMDIFMRLLIDKLQELWVYGVQTRDAESDNTFCIYTVVIWTINDYLAYALMSGWSIKGYKACPIYKDETPSVGVQSKVAYIGHKRFLLMDD